MARRGKRQKKSASEVQQFMQQDVDLRGGNSPAIDALLSQMSRGQLSPRDQAQLAAVLQQQATGIEMDPEMQAKLAQGLAEIRTSEEEWEKDRERFIENVMNEAPELTEEQKAKIQARVAKEYQAIKAHVGAERAVKKMDFHRAMKEMPTEKIFVEGKIEMHNTGRGGIRPVNVGETLKVNDIAVHLPRGTHEVPVPIAEKYRQMMESRQLNEELKNAMSVDEYKERLDLDRAILEINKKYKSSSELSGG